MPRVIHFEVPVDEPDRAVKFYEQVFGWKVHKWHGPVDYWLIITGKESEPGIDGAFVRRHHGRPTTVNTIDVPSVEEFMAKIAEQGGTVLSPKVTVPGVGYMAYCQDTEGNTFGIIERDESAA